MNKTRRYLTLTALFTILFILKHSIAAVACFLAAFLCVAGQMASLAKFLREKQLIAAQQMQQVASQQLESEAQAVDKETS